MAKAPTSVIGVDLGRYALKAVLLQRRGSRFVVTNYASQVLSGPAETSDQLGDELKTLFKNMGGTAKACAVGVSNPDALIRIIEQPETPAHILRDALRLNGMALLNQDVKDFVLDCDRVSPAASPGSMDGAAPRYRYLVGGLPRTHVTQVSEAFEKCGGQLGAMQIAPICAFNAFEFAHTDVFNNLPFFLVDIGHTNSTMMVGVQRELVLVRTIDFGGRALVEALTALSGEPRESVFSAMEQEDEVVVEYTRVALSSLIREVQSSIGFLEHQREQQVDRVFVSGGPAKSKALLKVLSEELRLPCESWSAVGRCDNGLNAAQRARFDADALDLNVACGAAAELLKGN